MIEESEGIHNCSEGFYLQCKTQPLKVKDPNTPKRRG